MHDLSEITPEMCDIDMFRFEGNLKLLFGLNGNPRIFGFHKKHPKLQGYQIIASEPWFIGFPEEHTSDVQAVVQDYLEFYPPGTSATNPFPQQRRVGMFRLHAILRDAGVSRVVLYQYGMKTTLYEAAKELIDFKRWDPKCVFHFDIATRIRARNIDGTPHTMLGYLDPAGVDR